MASGKGPQWSIERVFNRILLASLLLHVAMFFLVMTVEPPPPPSQEEYANWLKKVTPPKIVVEEVKIPEKKQEKVEKKEEEIPEIENTPAKAQARNKATKPANKGMQAAHRAAVREQISGAGLLAAIGTTSDEGTLAKVFESGAVVAKDLNAALSERASVRVSGDSRIGKKGALGAGAAADIGEVGAGSGGSLGAASNRAQVIPKAFVKSSEAVIKKGGIDEAGVRMALKRRERGIQQCYERELKGNVKLQGQITLEWTIDESGSVVKITIINNSTGSADIAECIKDIISRIHFPEAAEGVVPVRKTFEFKMGG